MKITKLKIDKHKHLENLEFDFTYPEGHPKAGKPLDKICFIGQSATGKTQLLELIFNCIDYTLKLEILNQNSLSRLLNNSEPNLEFDVNIGNEYFSFKNDEVTFGGKLYKYHNVGGSLTDLIPLSKKENGYFFKANLISDNNLEILSKNPVDLFDAKLNYPKEKTSENFNYFHGPTSVFDEKVDLEIWLLFLDEVLKYRKNFNRKMTELIHKGLLAKTDKLQIEFEKWQKTNPNPLILFAEKFNPLFEKLNLEIDTISTEYLIPISNKLNDEIIPIQNTSTGTKGLLLSFLPILYLKTSNSIILIDEPERSLYPDIQMKLMDYYKDFAPEAQFIVATHSPFIAASFEPEERFILYFDNEGKVAVRRGTSPIGDDPNDILTNDFGIDYINSYGQEKFQDYLELKQKMLFEENEELKKKYAQEVRELGDKYNF